MATRRERRARRGTKDTQSIVRASCGAYSDNQCTTMHNKGANRAMTTETTTNTANKVIVVGMLDTMLVRDRGEKRDGRGGRDQMIEVTRKSGRTRGTGGRWENLTLQVRSPYGGMFAMPIEIEPNVPGAE